MDRALLAAAVEALHIQAVYLRSGEIRCKDDFMPQFIEDDLSLIPQYRAGPKGELHIVTAKNKGSGDTIKTAIFYFAAGVRLIDGALMSGAETKEEIADDEVYVEITTEFCAQYDMDGTADENALRPALEEFGRYNVAYHVWPYWREYVQSVCARIGVPPIPVPMYRLPQREPAGEPGSEAGRAMSRTMEILERATKRKFADLYEAATPEAQELVDAFVDRVWAKYPDIRVYPTDTPDLRFAPGTRVAATLELKKRAPYLRLYLLDVPNAIPGSHLEFRTAVGLVLKSYVVIANKGDLDDAMLYMERSVENAKQE